MPDADSALGDKGPGFRSGFVSIVGRPNVGKSTLLNSLLNRKVAITSPKPHAARNAQLVPQLAAVEAMGAWREIIPISARDGRNVEQLRALLVGLLPEGPQYYPDNVFTDQPREFLVAEIIREKALELTRQEIP